MNQNFRFLTLISSCIAFSLCASDPLSIDEILKIKRELENDQIALAQLRESLSELQDERLFNLSELAHEVRAGQAEIGDLKERLVTTNVYQSSQTPCCDPCLPAIFDYRPAIDKSAVTTRLDYLFWTTEEGALTYVIKGQPTPPPGQAQGQIGELEQTKFGWDSGVRASLGYRFKPSFWEAEAQYTYISVNGSQTILPPDSATQFLTGTWTNLTAFPILRATSEIALKTQIADLALARRYLLEDHMLVRLLMGLTGAWIDQEWHFKYLGNNDSEANHKHDWSFSGGGMRVGLDMDWYIGWGFSLLGKLSAASFIGHYSSEMYGDTNNATVNRPPATTQSTRYGDQRLVFNTQYLMGPSWGKVINSWSLEIFAGYELNTWFNLQEQTQSSIESSSPTLSKPTILSTGLVGYQGFTGYLKLNF